MALTATAERTKTRTQLVYTQLRTQILRGVYEPGQRLRLVELAEHFAVSQSVIREALTRLAEQKLIIALPQQGFRMMALSVEDLHDLTEARIEIETLVLRFSVKRGSVQWESSLVAAHHQLARTPVVTDVDGTTNEQWFQAHEEFHRVLLAGCDNSWLTDLATELRATSELLRRWAGTRPHSPDRDVATEHREILDAVLARDAKAAPKLLAAHIQLTTDILLASSNVQS